MKPANYSYDTLSQWAEVPDVYTPLYVANKQEQGSIIPLHSNSQKNAGESIRTIKTPEQVLQELRECKEEDQPVWVYIYKHTATGCFATYEGIRCFIPPFLSGNKHYSPAEEDDLAKTWCQAYISRIDGEERVSLKAIKYLKVPPGQQTQINTQHLEEGMPFSGVVKKIKPGLITLLGHQVEGQLNIDEVIPKHSYATVTESVQRNRILRSIFILERPITAIINSISSDGIVTLTWDKKLPANAAICDAICSMGIRC